MTPERSCEFTARLENAALSLLKHAMFRKPDDLARRFGLPIKVVRYWWRNTDKKIKETDQSTWSTREVKMIRKAAQTLEGWERGKRYRPKFGASLINGRRCKKSITIRPPKEWDRGALADRCRMHGGLARIFRKNK